MLSLSFDLLSCPTCCINCSWREVPRSPSLFYQLCEPVLSVIIGHSSVGEGFAKIAVILRQTILNGCKKFEGLRNDAHASTQEAFVVVHILRNSLQELEDRSYVVLQEGSCHILLAASQSFSFGYFHTFWRALESQNQPRPGVSDS